MIEFHYVIKRKNIQMMAHSNSSSAQYTLITSIPPHNLSFRAIEETATVHDKPVEEVLIADCGIVSKPDSI